MDSRTPVIDFHIHLIATTESTPSFTNLMDISYPEKGGYEEARQRYSDPANFSALLRENGVDYGVILAEYSPLTIGYNTNEEVAAFCAGHKELLPFCSLNPNMHPHLGKTLKDLVKTYGFKGVKLENFTLEIV